MDLSILIIFSFDYFLNVLFFLIEYYFVLYKLDLNLNIVFLYLSFSCMYNYLFYVILSLFNE